MTELEMVELNVSLNYIISCSDLCQIPVSEKLNFQTKKLRRILFSHSLISLFKFFAVSNKVTQRY